MLTRTQLLEEARVLRPLLFGPLAVTLEYLIMALLEVLPGFVGLILHFVQADGAI